ncbi:hypothetical protein ASE63_08185 [Bosea sp. Root381]|nr:hypothetical protein ASE63_08185 [Bosea sp. Root381]
MPALSTLDLREANWSAIVRMMRDTGLSGYEPETMAAACAVIDRLGARDILDIGANIGIFSLVLKAIYGDKIAVTAFEPTPEIALKAERIAASNNLNIGLHKAAVGAEEGTATLYLSNASDASNSLNSEFRKPIGTVDVPLTTIDAITSSIPAPQLIKIDTETTEPDVLAGGLTFIRNTRPWIICEVLYSVTEEQIRSVIESIGYYPYALRGVALQEPDAILGDKENRFRDYLFAPEKPDAAFNEAYLDWVAAFSKAGLAPAT